MKAPRIVQSYWSKAYQNTPNSGWAFRVHPDFSVASSPASRIPRTSASAASVRTMAVRYWAARSMATSPSTTALPPSATTTSPPPFRSDG